MTTLYVPSARKISVRVKPIDWDTSHVGFDHLFELRGVHKLGRVLITWNYASQLENPYAVWIDGEAIAHMHSLNSAKITAWEHFQHKFLELIDETLSDL